MHFWFQGEKGDNEMLYDESPTSKVKYNNKSKWNYFEKFLKQASTGNSYRV